MNKYLPIDLIAIAKRTGRWWLKLVNGQEVLYTTNLGSYLRVHTAGVHQLQVNVYPNHNHQSAQQQYTIRIDGQQWHRYPASAREIALQLTADPHEIEIMTGGNTDDDLVWAGDQGFAITGIETDDGVLTASPHRRPVIDFIGDSITAGCWVAGQHPASDYRPETNYAAICADILNADSVRIAYSAGGVLRRATGGVPTADQFLTHTDAHTRWQPNQPDLVIINIGVNDRRFTATDFKCAYDKFIQQVVTTFPTAKIMVMVPFSQTYATIIRIVAVHHQLPIIETAGWCNSFTDGLHPDQAGANEAGQRLAEFLSTAF